jgi:glycine oxidase
MYDYAILGGGIVGLSLAWRLAERGQRVALLDRKRVGQEASSAAAGMLAPSSEAQFGETPLARLGVAAVRFYDGFIEALSARSSEDIDYGQGPSLLAALDRDDAASLRHNLTLQRALDLPVRWISRDECQALEPTLSPRVVGGVLCESDKWVDNCQLIKALAIACKRAGVKMIENTFARLWLSDDTSSPACLGLRPDDGEGEPIAARVTILAAGAWSAQAWPDDYPGPRPPIRPVKGQIMAVQSTPGLSLSHTVRSPRVYLVPRRNGQVIVGATSEERGFDRSLTAGGLYHLLQNAVELWPAIQELEVTSTWTGLRPGIHDNLPLLGPSSHVAHLHYATGHYRNGILLGPITASLLAQSLLSGELPDALTPFLPSRLGL